MKIRRLLTFIVVPLVVGSITARAEDKTAIGRIASMDKKYWNLRVNGSGGERDAVAGLPIYESDQIQTIASQHVTLLMDDGTELVIGPSSRVGFENWNGRDGEGHRVRVVELVSGMLKAKVSKIYSQEEPFVIHNRNGAVAVRGTEFVTEAGSGGRLESSRNFSQAEKANRKNELEVHTLEGEVHLAKDIPSLRSESSRVSVPAGTTSLVRQTMTRPQTAHSFDVKKFTTYIAKAVPGIQIAVTRTTTNEKRAQLAENTAQKSDKKSISPAAPDFAKIKTPTGPDRSLASVNTAKALSGKPEQDSHERRKAVGFEKVDKRSASELLGAAKNRPPTFDGVRQAFQGGEQLMSAQNNNSERIANQRGEEIGQANARIRRRDREFRHLPPRVARTGLNVGGAPPPPPPPRGTR